MAQYQVSRKAPNPPEGFPFAVIDQYRSKDKVLGWFRVEADAKAFADMEANNDYARGHSRHAGYCRGYIQGRMAR